MTSVVSVCVEEDEDVIIKGSDLYEALSKMGYTEFECTSKPLLSEHVDSSANEDTSISNQTTRHNLMSIYHYVTQIKDMSEKQLRIILQAEPLLDDHASYIQSFIREDRPTFWRKALGKLPLIGSTITTATSVILGKRKGILTLMCILPVITIAVHLKYLRWRASKDLRNLISLQKELYLLCKKGLRILHHGYSVKLRSNKSKSKFSNLGLQRLKHLQPVMEIMLKYIEDMSRIYYQTSLIIAKLLPKSYRTKYLMTVFENEIFTVNGEVTYEMLKHMYYTYILTQSDMLQLLAIAYNSDTWLEYGTIPETKLAHIIHTLLRLLKKYKSGMSEEIDNYCACEILPVYHEYRGPSGSKWQDFYAHLNLTSYKIQMAYNHIELILKDIEMCIDKNTNDVAFDEMMIQKMNDVCKQIDTVRNFAEFGSLLLVKLQNISRNKKGNCEISANSFTTILEPKMPVVQDSDPEIIDEVFEEYIKEEYLKPLYEDSSDVLQQNYKLDKLLANNFMSELKEVLIDKYKSMSERESKALQRRYKITEKSFSENEQNLNRDDLNSGIDVRTKPVCLKSSFKCDGESINRAKLAASDCETTIDRTLIPPPPPLPSLNVVAPLSDNCDFTNDWKEENQLSISFPQIPSNQESRHKDSESHENMVSLEDINVSNSHRDKSMVSSVSLVNEGTRSPIYPPTFGEQLRSFFTVAEETFIGSGENSEDELAGSEPEEDEICS